MPIETLLALLMVGVLAFLALIAASPGPIHDRLGRTRLRAGAADGSVAPAGASALDSGGTDDDVSAHQASSPVRRQGAASTAPAAASRAEPGGAEGRSDDLLLWDARDEPGGRAELRPAALERVIRVGTWIFLFTATGFVGATQLWAAQQALILMLLAAAAISTFVVHEVIGGRHPSQRILVLEGALGLTFASALVALTGGAMSLFYAALPLIVVGAAIVVTPGVTLVLTAAAGLAYIVAIVMAVIAGQADLGPLELATAGINLTVLCLVAYVGMAIGREQRRARDTANRLATVDPLTGLNNRGFLFGALERELDRTQRTERGFCLMMIDLDDLKVINDRYGHLVGDRALRAVGGVIRAGTRSLDTGARFGGDEFVVILPETDPAGGLVLAEKIRQGVADAGLVANGSLVPTSVSVGLVACPQDGETADELLERADAAMYRSKQGGRDRVTRVMVMDIEGARLPTPAGGGGDPV